VAVATTSSADPRRAKAMEEAWRQRQIDQLLVDVLELGRPIRDDREPPSGVMSASSCSNSFDAGSCVTLSGQ